MLSWSETLDYVKTSLGFPHTFIEYSDEELVKILQQATLRKFSAFFPDKRSLGLDLNDVKNKVPNREDLFYVTDPDKREILSIDEFVPDAGTYFITGHPWMGSFGWEGTPEQMALNAFRANNLRQFSIFNYTIKFLPPNQMRVMPRYNGICSLEYSRVHAPDLSTLPPDLIEYFKDLCLAVFKMRIGSLRKNYNTVNTPFGEIPLNGDTIYSEGESLYNQLMDRFEAASAPFIIVDVG